MSNYAPRFILVWDWGKRTYDAVPYRITPGRLQTQVLTTVVLPASYRAHPPETDA